MASDLFQIVGTTIAGNYEVEAVVAEGGFAVVYRALHKGFDAPVALKCLKLSSKLARDRQEQFLAQFKSEAALLFQLSASIPTVIRPLHIDALTTADGTFVPYMVLEWLEGETLAAITEQRAADNRPAPPLKKIVRLITPVAQALERAHNFRSADGKAVSIVHCDVKPENIFVASVAGEQVVKILDFGVARAQSVASQVAGAGADKPGGVLSFTPAYAAPEQWSPENYGETGPWTDVWGLALTLVETMAGRPIIDGDVGAMMGIALDPMMRPTPRNNDLDVPDAVEEVFEAAMAVRPQDRFAHAGLFWDELQVALGMKEGRPRDARREVGTMLREERIEVAKPRVQTRIKKLQLAAAKPAPFKAAKGRLTIDDPFEQEDRALAALDMPGIGLEAAIPSVPPAGQAARRPAVPGPFAGPPAGRAGPPPRKESLEFSIPSEPPPAMSSGLEASFESIPPGAAAAPPVMAAPAPAAVPRAEPAAPAVAPLAAAAAPPAPPAVAPPAPAEIPTPPAAAPPRPPAPSADEFELALPAQKKPAPRRQADLEAALPSSPMARAGRNPTTGELELGADAPALRVDLRSELPPRGAAPPAVVLQRAPLPRVDLAPRTAERSGSVASLWRIGVGLLVAAIAVGIAGSFLRGEDGESKLALGPVSPTVVAGALFAVGVAFLIYGLLPRDR